MQTVRVEIPADLVVAAGLDAANLSAEATRLLALELYREDRVSLGRAASRGRRASPSPAVWECLSRAPEGASCRIFAKRT